MESALPHRPTSSRDDSARRPFRALLPGIAGLIAVLAGVALVIAPVQTAKVVVDWPERAGTPQSSALLLVNQTPHDLDLRFTSADVRAAAAADGTLFATLRPGATGAATDGLLVTAAGSDLTVATHGRTTTIPAGGEAVWRLHADIGGTTLSRDGTRVLRWADALPPQVDALITSVPGPDAGITARLQVADDADDRPTVVKVGLMVVLWLALLVALATLRIDDLARSPRVRRPLRRIADRLREAITVTDAIVIAVLALWILIGPMTDDDGYYANMSLSYGTAGYVGNYYQLFDNNFTPFTWFWQFLYVWQEIGGRSSVWLRVPALICAVVAWMVTRRLLDRAVGRMRPWPRRGARAVLALVFLSWWLPYAVGSRPEILGSLATVLALAGVVRAIRTRRLLPAALGAAAAGLAFAAHPTGAVAFAPLLFATPALWRIAGDDGAGPWRRLSRAVGVVSVGAIALFAGFADGSLVDMITNQRQFAAVETPLTWASEWMRYQFLLGPIPMGSYAKRAVVLVALVLLLWFVVLFAVSRWRRRPALSTAFALTGWSMAGGFLLLWITPSKWTHHFGALSSVGSLFAVVMLVGAPAAVRGLLGSRSMPLWLPVVGIASLVPAIIVSFLGPNLWAYAWDQSMPRSGESPGIGSLAFDSLPVLGALGVVTVVVTGLIVRRRWREPVLLVSSGVLVTGFLVLSTGFLVGSFTVAAVHPAGGFSTGAANLADPTGRQCRIDHAITVWDATAGRPLATTADAGAPPPPGLPIGSPFVADGSWRDGDAPPPFDDRRVAVWASAGAVTSAVGTTTTPWYALPPLASGQRIATLVGGLLGPADDDQLIVQFGRVDGDVVHLVGQQSLRDSADRPGWRSMAIAVPTDGSATVLRIVGVDGETGPQGWLGFSAPVVVDGRPLAAVVPSGEPTAISWTSAYWFPCDRPMTIARGIIEPPAMATTWADSSAAVDNIWLPSRGGSLAGVARLATVSTPISSMTGVGDEWSRIELFRYPVAKSAYRTSVTWVTTPGWIPAFAPTTQLYLAAR